MNKTKDVFMEDVAKITLDSTEYIIRQLAIHGYTVKPEEEDLIYLPLLDIVDKFFNFPDYRHHN